MVPMAILDQRERHQITGRVQGVGFRPHVAKIAQILQLTGWVQNTPQGVLVEVQGQQSPFFLQHLLATLPPLAKIAAIKTQRLDPNDEEDQFLIKPSEAGLSTTIIAPDTAPCDACQKELLAPDSHYYHYPFLNCTQCGPRFTITHRLPYDRDNTALAGFALCSRCEQDYAEPTNRRYHAQPTACMQCGPRLDTSLEEIAENLKKGKIIALKSVGGYQLLADATNRLAVLRLRTRKQRESKPFALLVANLEIAKTLGCIRVEEEKLLLSKERPIVLIKKHQEVLPKEIAPGLNHFGLMLPSSPLQELLFKGNLPTPKILIATSANCNGEPLIIDDKQAQSELVTIADKTIAYNRIITSRLDDSVIRVTAKQPVFIRRARGYVPDPIPLAEEIPSTLALGAHLKNTFCLTRGKEAFVSQHIGSLTNKATIKFFHETLDHFCRFLNIKPQRIAHDLHPDFYTTRLAQQYDLPTFPIQHHHAHLAAVMAEYQLTQPTLGLALDGYGLGTDGNAWGGELLYLENTDFTRLAHFLPLPQPGGEFAAKEPWRMAASVMHLNQQSDAIIKRFSHHPQAQNLKNLLENSQKLPLTSSCGRWFDAASALLGISEISHYEGQAAMLMEAQVTHIEAFPQGFNLENGCLNLLPLMQQLSPQNSERGANLFHGTLILGLCHWITHWAKKTASTKVVLSGGCFLNEVLAQGLIDALKQAGLTPYLPKLIPPNDGGVSLGQAWIAGRESVQL